jgi:MSHA biogenesis protein MshN
VALGLLVDANIKEARALLAQGLELNPQDALLASTLARISADEDLAGAIALLKAALPSHAGTSARTESAEARALLATLQQRSGNHAEAIDNYGTALRVAPGNGAWWIGLGISLAAAGRADSARQAFEQARSTETLSPELVRYVEQRLASSAH